MSPNDRHRLSAQDIRSKTFADAELPREYFKDDPVEAYYQGVWWEAIVTVRNAFAASDYRRGVQDRVRLQLTADGSIQMFDLAMVRAGREYNYAKNTTSRVPASVLELSETAFYAKNPMSHVLEPSTTASKAFNESSRDEGEARTAQAFQQDFLGILVDDSE